MTYNELWVLEIVTGEIGITLRQITNRYGSGLRSSAWSLLDRGVLDFNDRLGLYIRDEDIIS